MDMWYALFGEKGVPGGQQGHVNTIENRKGRGDLRAEGVRYVILKWVWFIKVVIIFL